MEEKSGQESPPDRLKNPVNDYFFSVLASSFLPSSFFLISPLPPHFSHSLPSLTAATQHLGVQGLPAAAAFLQQGACSARAAAAMNATAQGISVNRLLGFIFSPFKRSVVLNHAVYRSPSP